MKELFGDKRFIVITGNYGSGKTELSLNLALHYAETEKTTLVDLDIVNPYFRTGEKADMLRDAGVRVLMPTFAMTTVDIPALPAEIQSVFEVSSDRVLFDVGGDDTGAAALGRYYPSFMKERENTIVALVINCMRPLTMEEEDITDMARRIENRGRLRIDLLINNTNLADETTPEMIEKGEKTVRLPTVFAGYNSKDLYTVVKEAFALPSWEYTGLNVVKGSATNDLGYIIDYEGVLGTFNYNYTKLDDFSTDRIAKANMKSTKEWKKPLDRWMEVTEDHMVFVDASGKILVELVHQPE